MSPFKSFVFVSLGLRFIPPFARMFKSPINDKIRKIRDLRERRKIGPAIEIAREWKPYRRYSLPLAREIARAESAGRLWREAAESWKVVCGFPIGTRRKDWLQLAKVQQTAGFWEDAIETIGKIRERYPEFDVTSMSDRMQAIRAGYGQVEQEVLACEPGAYKITYLRNKKPSDTVVVTFGIIYSDFFTTPFGFPFITLQGFDHIHVAQERFTFYQSLDLDTFLAAVGGVCEGKNVVAYGSSIGAYAAFYFGGPLGAKILAASPRNSVDHCIREFSKQWKHLDWKHGRIPDNRASPWKPVVFWDPLGDKRDGIYLEERIIPAYPEIDIIGIPHGGHATFHFLQGKKILKDVFLSVVRGDFSVEDTMKSLNLSPGLVEGAEDNGAGSVKSDFSTKRDF